MIDRTPGLLAGCRVLVAEDEVHIMMLLEDMLEELDAEVIGPVESVREILRVLEEERLDAVTLDVHLKGEPAYEAAAILRERGIPFVFVSGYDVLPDCPPDLKDIPRVRKPFRLVELAAALDKVVNPSRSS